MTHISYRGAELVMEGVPLLDIADRFATPCYVYSQSAIEEAYLSYRDAFTQNTPLICYAVKANSNQAVLRCLGALGAGADVVSEGELLRALQAGISPKKIVFSGTGKEAREIAAALKAGILQINLESESELRLVAQIAEQMKVQAPLAFRVNPDIDAKTHAKISTGHAESKFGIDIDTAFALYREAARHPYLSPQGLAVHIGSQILELQPYVAAWRALGKLAQRIKAENLPLERLDAGGGLGIAYRNEGVISPSAYAQALEKELGDFPLIIEPGRSIVGPAGILLSRVLVVKKGKKKNFAILDAGMSDLLRPALYDAWHEFLPVAKPGESQKVLTYDLVGPICETGDSFATDRVLPELKEGDFLAIKSAGAYGAVMSSQYNSRPLTAEILVKGKQAALIRSRESLEDMIRRDILPDWL